MGNEMLTFMMFMMMNDKNRPIPFETVLSSSDMVPAPMRFAVQANTIQNVESSCALEDEGLRKEVATFMTDHKITPKTLKDKYGRIYSFVQSDLPKDALG